MKEEKYNPAILPSCRNTSAAREYNEWRYPHKLDNLEMGTVLEMYSLQSWIKKKLNRPITGGETGSVILKNSLWKTTQLTANKSLGLGSFTGEFHQTKKNVHPSFSNSSRRLKRREHSQRLLWSYCLRDTKPDKDTSRKEITGHCLMNRDGQNPQQNTDKPNSTTHNKSDHTPGLS